MMKPDNPSLNAKNPVLVAFEFASPAAVYAANATGGVINEMIAK